MRCGMINRMISGRFNQSVQDAPQSQVPAVGAPDGSDQGNSLRKVGLAMSLAMVFLYFSMLHMTLFVVTRGMIKPLYIVGPLAIIGIVLGGGIPRAFRGRPTFYWLAFLVWMVLALPFSSWKGGSSLWLWGYLKAHFIMLFAIGGMVVSWRECRVVMSTVAIATMIALVTVRVFGRSFSGRVGAEWGTINNPNDLAAHMLLVVPFMLWLVLASKSVVLRLAACGGIAYGMFLILASGSRGAVVASVVAILFYLIRATARQRGIALLAIPVLVAALLGVVPQRSLDRIVTLTSSSGDDTTDTGGSSASRMYLLKTGIRFAFEHPIFGVGQGMFAIYEGSHGTSVGGYRGEYQEAHNSYVAAAAECGIPAFIFYMAGVFSSFRLLNSVHRQACGRPDCHDIRVTTFCIQLGMVGFCTAIFFVNFTYLYYLPALAGLSVAVFHAAQAEFRSRSSVSPAPQTVYPVWHALHRLAR